MHRRHDLSGQAALVPVQSRFARRAFLFSLCLPFLAPLAAQVRPVPPGGGGGGIVITPPILPPGGGVVTPPIIIGPGGGNTQPTANITAPRGALVGDAITATAVIVDPTAPAGATTSGAYQWTVTGARLLSDPRANSIQFVADRAGVVSLAVSISANGSGYNPTAQVTVLDAGSAGAITAPSTTRALATGAPANAPGSTITASVPAAVRNDRTFRWTVSGDATIASGANTRSITLRPGSAGLKEIVCNVTLQNVVTVPVRAFLVVTGTGDESELEIVNGSGDGTHPAGSRVDIFANPPPEGHVFDRWTGDTAVLGAGPLAAFLPHTVITVPELPPGSRTTLTATYKPAPAWTPAKVEDFNPQTQPAAGGQPAATVSTTLIHHLPAEPAGLVFLLHQTGGSGADWFSRAEQLLLARDLVAAGYGVASLDSLNRTTGAWATQTTLATNLDARNFAAAHDHLVNTGALPAGAPLFFLGIADGANAGLRYADLLATGAGARPVKGAVLYVASGIDTLAVTSRIPQFFALAANDETLGAAGLAAARDNAQLLQGRGVATGTINNAVSPVYPTRFRRLGLAGPAFTVEDADTVWTAVKESGALDANNYPKSIPAVAALSTALPASLRERAPDVAAQLAIAAAHSQFFSDANPRVIQFLDARAADAPAAAPGRLVNLSARSKVAHIADTFTLGFTLTGTQRATVLIRGVGPALSRFGVRDPLGAPRLTLNQGTRVLATNEGWDRATNAAQVAAVSASVGAFALPAGSTDAAILTQLDPGSYTLTIRGLGATTGTALAELYDISRNATRLTNLSTLTRIDDDGELVIPGIVIAGNNPRTVVVRAVGPGLTDLGYAAADTLGDPRLVILRGNQTVAQNNNWAQAGAPLLTAVFPAIGAFPLRNAADAAVLESIAPGAYTLQAGAAPVATPPAGSGLTVVAPNQTGAILLELYEVP